MLSLLIYIFLLPRVFESRRKTALLGGSGAAVTVIIDVTMMTTVSSVTLLKSKRTLYQEGKMCLVKDN